MMSMNSKLSLTKTIRSFLKKKYISIRNRLILFNNHRKVLISLEFEGKIPHLEMNEKYEPFVKWSLRILTLIGILISFFTLNTLTSIFLTIFLLIIEKILEKVVFNFTSLFIQPIPDYEHNSWLAMLYMIPIEFNDWKIGMLFQEEETAIKIFNCIRSWNYFEKNDEDNNIQISFIIEDNEEEYSVYIYPSFKRKTVQYAKEIVEKEQFEKRVLKDHRQLIMTAIFCRIFPNPPDSHFNQFISRYKSNDPYEFGIFSLTQKIPEIKDGKPLILQPGAIHEVMKNDSIIKTHLKIARRSELSKNDLEYDYGRLVMDK